MHFPLRPLLTSAAAAAVGGALLALPAVTPVALTAAAPAGALPAAAPAAVPATAPVAAQVLRAQRALGLDCALTPGGVPLCLHGEDAPPVDRHDAAGGGSGTTPTTGRIGCYGTGTDGRRVHAVYARPQTSPDRYAESLAPIRRWAAGVSSQFDASAERTGGRRHLRFATTPGPSCVVTVQSVVLPDAAFSSFHKTVDALEARGLDAQHAKYLVWADADRACGWATSYADDKPGLDNLNNSSLPSYARVDRRCWGKVETHEVVHMLGGVQPSARNATRGFHCNDGVDVMCYDDGTAGGAQHRVCGADRVQLLDCRNDDYFSTSAPRGSYLQTHWNTARSSFLEPALSDPPPARPTPAPTASPRPAASPSPSPSAPATVVDPATLLAPLPTLVPTLLTMLPVLSR